MKLLFLVNLFNLYVVALKLVTGIVIGQFTLSPGPPRTAIGGHCFSPG